MQQRIEQHRAVSGREHEPVAIGPNGIGRVEFQETGEQHRRDVGCPHGQAGMARLGLLHGIHRERADGVRHFHMLGARDVRALVMTCGRGLGGCRWSGGEG
jgi:hypothetical protein